MDNEIKITAYREDEGEQWRINRLERVVGYVAALANCYNYKSLLGKIYHLHDHKGSLSVIWNNAPRSKELLFFKQAWLSEIGDGCDNVEHSIKKEVILELKKN